MAVGIENFDNVTSPDADYPKGRIKDDTGADDGTPVDLKTYGDIHQTFAKLLRLPGAFSGNGITPNGVHDNEYTGFQYVQAMMELFGRCKRLFVKDGVPASDVVESDYNTVVLLRETAQTGHTTSMQAPSGSNIGFITIYNYSPHSNIVATLGGENINGVAPPFILPTQTAIKFKYTLSGPNWTIEERYSLDN